MSASLAVYIGMQLRRLERVQWGSKPIGQISVALLSV